MKKEKIEQLIEMGKNEGLASLKYEDKDFKLAVSWVPEGQVTLPHPVQTSAPAAAPKGEAQPKQALAASSGHHEVCSPLVGTFYSSSAPGEPAFVKIGDRVSKGQVLCIVEAMKIMNEVEADISGEVVEIHVENEGLVEFGQTLFSIKP